MSHTLCLHSLSFPCALWGVLGIYFFTIASFSHRHPTLSDKPARALEKCSYQLQSTGPSIKLKKSPSPLAVLERRSFHISMLYLNLFSEPNIYVSIFDQTSRAANKERAAVGAFFISFSKLSSLTDSRRALTSTESFITAHTWSLNHRVARVEVARPIINRGNCN